MSKLKTKRLTCNSCQLLAINGVACHEIGCPEAWKGYRVECKNCGKHFLPKEKHQDCCTKACRKSYWGY